MSAVPLLLTRAFFGAAVVVALAGCSDEREPERRERVTAPAGDAVARLTWLSPTEATEPALWLASREAGGDVAPSDPAVADWQARLADADDRFGETDRMIANRAVQLETMLGEIKVAEPAREILADFSGLAAKGSRSGFSDLCQHYYNLRARGLSREDALAALRSEGGKAGEGAP